MVTYIALLNLTDQGLRNIKDTTKRAAAAQKLGKEFGVEFKSIHWTQGAFDVVIELQAKDEQSANAFLLASASLGNFHAQTLRAFSAEEMDKILAKVPKSA
jgi:uncharacterized protein with GYD domain